jgi:hypothetical protein
MMKRCFGVFMILLGVCGSAAASPLFIEVDEYGHGLPYTLAPDPREVNNTNNPNAGLDALTYTLPFRGVRGDVRLFDPPFDPGAEPSDVVRFNRDFTLIIYSDHDPQQGGADGPLADLGHLRKLDFYNNTIRVDEAGVEGANGFFYTPGVGDPGFDSSLTYEVTYRFISDAAAIPEPASLVLLGTGICGLVARRQKRKAL